MKKIRNFITLVFLLWTFTAFSQLSDNFSDGDFLTNPTWAGSESLFAINSLGQLQTVGTTAGQAYLNTSFSQTSLDNKEWNLFVRQTFSGSDNNQSRIYISSNGPITAYTGNGTAGVQGYFLKLGEGGSTDAIRLFLDNGVDNPVELASCTSGAIASSFSARIKITRSAADLWSIAVDYTGGFNFIEEASFTENSYTTSSSLGLICSYTVSNADNFFFDDFYFGEIIVDTTPPSVLSVAATSTTVVEVLFNEPVSENSGENPANYALNGTQAPISAIRDNANNALVTLTFNPAFAGNTDQELSISNIQDLEANTMAAFNTTFQFFIPAAPEFRSVVFNEVLADPSPSAGLPEFEFVEIFNASQETFLLENWQFVNSTTSKLLPAVTMSPGQYYILCDVTAAPNFSNAIPISSFTALTNAGDSLTLIDNNGNIIDLLVYSDDWFATAEKLNGGWTLEQKNPFFPCASSANWSESNAPQGGTPASQNSVYIDVPDNTPPALVQSSATANSIILAFNETMEDDDPSSFNITITPTVPIQNIQWINNLSALLISLNGSLETGVSYSLNITGPNDCSGNGNDPYNATIVLGFTPQINDLKINEILADPDPPVSGAPQLAEFIEIYNRSEKVLDLTGLKVNSGTLVGSLLMYPDEYLILTSTSNVDLFTSFNNAAAVTSFPGLTNTGTTVNISHPESGIIDEVTYSSIWYNDEEKEDGGYSLELINPDFPCASVFNWSASQSSLGTTAGAINSVYSNTLDNTAPTVAGILAPATGTFIIVFNETMSSDIPSSDNILISPDLGIVNSTWLPGGNGLQLFLNQSWQPGITYSLSFNDLTDCSGNFLNDTIIDFVKGFQPQQGDLIINEIMAAPSQTINTYRAEFFEIYNKSDKLIDLSFILVNDIPLGLSASIGPGEYRVVADDASESLLSSIDEALFMTSFPSLTNSGDTIRLSHPDTGLLDIVGYTDQWYRDNSKNDGGWSIELVNPLDPCSTADNWRASVSIEGATPGSVNSVLNLAPDTQGPALLAVYSGVFSPVTLVFNEPISEESLSEFSWTVNGQSSTPVFIEFGNADRTIIRVTTSGVISGQVYNFTISSIEDCWGNISSNVTGVYSGAEDAIPGDLIINEVLSNPFEDGFDFVEIYNRSQKIISLSSWLIATETDGAISNSEIITDFGYNLLPGQYLVLTEDGTELQTYYPFTENSRILQVADLPSYNNTEGIVVLQLPNTEVSDRFEYKESMHFPLIEDLDGVSLERIDPKRPASDDTNWSSAAASQGYATPGYQNSQALAAVFGDDDITISPEIFSPDNDGFNDVVTITYQNLDPSLIANIFIYDAAGRPVKHLTKSELLGVNGAISWNGTNEDNLLASIGVYIVYFEVFSQDGKTSRFKKTVVLAQRLD